MRKTKTKTMRSFLLLALMAVFVSGLLVWGVVAQAQDLDWVRQAGGTHQNQDDQGQGIAVDGQGNSYVTGLFAGMATFGPGEPNETTLKSAGFADIFVAKYASDGILLWVKQAGGTDQDQGESIAVDGQGNSYVTGPVPRYGHLWSR